MKCKISGCENSAKSRQLCIKHYVKARRAREIPGVKKCVIRDCGRGAEGGELCSLHAYRKKAKGSATARTYFDRNEFVDRGAFYEIKLVNRQGEFIANALIDKKDRKLCEPYRWSRTGKGGYVQSSAKKLRLHRVILGLTDPSIEADHKDGNALDNRRFNLRVCTRQQNSYNQGVSKRNTSGYKGISWESRRRRWKVGLRARGKYCWVGRFHDLNVAIVAHDKKALQLQGECARLSGGI